MNQMKLQINIRWLKNVFQIGIKVDVSPVTNETRCASPLSHRQLLEQVERAWSLCDPPWNRRSGQCLNGDNSISRLIGLSE